MSRMNQIVARLTQTAAKPKYENLSKAGNTLIDLSNLAMMIEKQGFKLEECDLDSSVAVLRCRAKGLSDKALGTVLDHLAEALGVNFARKSKSGDDIDETWAAKDRDFRLNGYSGKVTLVATGDNRSKMVFSITLELGLDY